jgi:hypothetical protein
VMTFPTGREMLLDNRMLQRTDPKGHCLDTHKWRYCQVKSVCRKPGTSTRQPSPASEWRPYGADRPLKGTDQAQNPESEEKS